MGDVFKALADPTRRRILDELVERDGQTLFELCSRLAVKHGLSTSRQGISQHLDVLEAARLVKTRRDGRRKLHFIDTTPLRAVVQRWPIDTRGKAMPRIYVTSVFVDDQEKALRFYTDVLGFTKKVDVPVGDARWLTVVSPDDPGGPELLLEPSDHPAVGPFKNALQGDGIPVTSFSTPDVQAEYERLTALGVEFTQAPVDLGPVTTAVLDDTCGNLIQLATLHG